MFYDPLVLGRASSFDARVGNESAILRNTRIRLKTDGVLVKRAWRQIAMNFGHSPTVTREIECA